VQEKPGNHSEPECDLTPEGRRLNALRQLHELRSDPDKRATLRARTVAILRRVWTGVYHDGFIHAGNLAYMSLLALFPFFIVTAAIFSVLGEQSFKAETIDAVLVAVPPSVARALGPAAQHAVDAREGWLLWVGAVFGLWTASSLIETIRDILHRSYGTRPTQAFWHYRITSTGLIFASVVLLQVALSAQVAISTIQQLLVSWFPGADRVLQGLFISRIASGIAIYLSIFLLFVSLTPQAYKGKAYPKWPGAALVTVWWLAITIVMPRLLSNLFRYDLTYGSLAGVMIALFFFWLVGLGLVVGAEFNAAIAESPEERDLRRLAELPATQSDVQDGNV